jgi:hypothetical protein
MSESFLDTPDDLDWLFETHLKHLADERSKYKSAVLFGNEDCPYMVWLYTSSDPLLTANKRIITLRLVAGCLVAGCCKTKTSEQ